MTSKYDRLEAIAVLLPQESAEERSFFMRLLGLLITLPGASTNEGALFFMPTEPEDALPYLMMQMEDVPFPYLAFSTDRLIYAEAGRLLLSNMPPQLLPALLPPATAIPPPEGITPLALNELIMRLHGRLVRLDHMGVNIPASSVSREDWEHLLHTIAHVANIYRYPTGEDWPFIVPATASEFKGDITSFSIGRGPKFELVYDSYSELPVWQIDLATDIPRDELEDLLPAPHGMALPGVGEYFRSVYVEHPWPGLLLRLDLRYKSDGAPSDWDTGEWLVQEGKRVKP